MLWSGSVRSAAALVSGGAIAEVDFFGSACSLRKLVISGEGTSSAQQVSVAGYAPVTGGSLSGPTIFPQPISYEQLLANATPVRPANLNSQFSSDPVPAGDPLFEVGLSTEGDPVVLEWAKGQFVIGPNCSGAGPGSFGLFNSGPSAPAGFVYLVTFEIESLN